MHHQSPEKALTQLMHELFDAEELRSFLRGLGGDERLATALPGGSVTDEALFAGAVAALNRRGRVDVDFFASLVAERPRQASRVAEVQRAWTGQRLLVAVQPPPVGDRLHEERQAANTSTHAPEDTDPAQPRGQLVDNRGARIGQQINVQGSAALTFGASYPGPKHR